MSLSDNQITAKNFKEFYEKLLPYFNPSDYSGISNDANNFDTTEKVIGTWIDGKPLYQKTLTGTGTGDINLTSLSIDTVVSIIGTHIRVNASVGDIVVPLSSSDNNIDVLAKYYKNTSKLTVVCVPGTGESAGNYAITIKYTKTTDSAVSSGEKIVGQWVDGKAIYEKVFSTNINLPAPSTTSTSWINSGLSAVGIDSIISGSMIDSDGQYFIANFCKMNSNTNIGFYPLYYVGARTIVNVTIRYTKTTD